MSKNKFYTLVTCVDGEEDHSRAYSKYALAAAAAKRLLKRWLKAEQDQPRHYRQAGLAVVIEALTNENIERAIAAWNAYQNADGQPCNELRIDQATLES